RRRFRSWSGHSSLSRSATYPSASRRATGYKTWKAKSTRRTPTSCTPISGPDRRPIRNDERDEDLHPVFSILETDYGLAICARRDAGPDKYYWRITPFMLPSYTIIPGTFGGSWTFTGAVPCDDRTMIGITATWNPSAAIPKRP